MQKYSPTYTALVDMFFRYGQQSRQSNSFAHQFDGMKYNRKDTGIQSHRLNQEIVIADTTLFASSTSAEWYVIGTILSELHEYNALWHCSPDLKRSSANRKAIKGLIERKIIVKTETTDIYLVNPLYIRRGDTFAVLATTARLLMDEPKVGIEHVTAKKPVDVLDLSFDILRLEN